MEGESPTTPDEEDVPGDLTSINLEDTFITLQTNTGQSSQKIPLFQFIEQVIGGKVNNEIKSKAMSLLMSGNKHLIENNVSSASKSSWEIENSSIVQDVKEVTSLKTIIPQKPKGRGRPRKIKVEVNDAELTLNATSSSTIVQQQHKRDDMALSKVEDRLVVTPSPSLRRSSRVPTKNSKFKDDFVDSSVLTSKSASGDTRLMTLALAAECHTTKPNKQTTVFIKPVSSVNHVGDALLESNNDKVTFNEIPTIDITDAKVYKYEIKENKNDISANQASEPPNVKKCPGFDNVIKRPLQSQLDLCISETKKDLSNSDKALPTDIEKEQECPLPNHFYIITEPKDNPTDNVFLVQNFGNEIKFNITELCGKVSKEQSDITPGTYPQQRYFKCDLCEKIFQSASQWQLHYKTEHYIQPSKESLTLQKEICSCPHCKQKFPFQYMLDHHLQKETKCNASFCCACNQKFSSQEELEEHQSLAHPVLKCGVCGEHFEDVMMLKKHANNCPGKSYKHLETIENQSVSPIENALTSQEEEVFRQREGNEIDQDTNLESMDMIAVKVGCEFCDLKFSTYSGLWHHQLEAHQEFYPSGFKEKLEARLEKGQQMLSSISHSTTSTNGENKNNYFVFMKPKWYCSKLQLKASMENKNFNFSPITSTKTDISSDDLLISGESVSEIQKGVVFHCSECVTYFQSASEYREHRSKVHSECFETVRYLGAFQCTYCSDTFPCQYMLNEHVKQHKGRKLLPCTLCGLTFRKIQDRRQHWKQVHPGVGCPNCGKMYASIKYLQKHISLNCQDHYPATKKFLAFRKKQHNDFHIDETEKRVEKKIIKCHLCSKVCCSVHGWRRHMSENHEDEGFSKLSNTCIICNEVIYGYKALEKHLLDVHAEESGLPVEEEDTIVKEAVEKSKVHIQDYQKAGKSNTNIYQDEEGMFHCPECPKTHSDLKALLIHIKTHVNMQLECSICNKSFKNPTLLKQHVMRHRTTAVYKCDTCEKKFLTLQKLNKHNKVHHSKENFVCELCGMSFALNDYLLKHKRCHTDKRPHSCSICGKTFRTKPELRVHVLIHTQETPYVCEHCGRGFTQKGNWRIHLAQHTGVKPNKCNQCELSFALPSHLKRHLLTHDQKINYRCVWCDKECTLRKHMQMHVSRVHKEDFFQYEEQMKLDNPVPIAPSQMKIYNRRLGKAGQVRKPYKTRAKKSKSSIQDILDGVAKFETVEEEEMVESNVVIKPMMIETNEETVTSDISITNTDITADNMQILVSEDHHNYVKHDIPAGLIEEDGSNVEIIMGDNNEINIIINNTENSINTDLTLQDGLDETGHVSLTHFTDASGQLPSSLQQAVNALVAGQKVDDVEVGDDPGLPLDMEAMITGDNYTIVYPSGS